MKQTLLTACSLVLLFFLLPMLLFRPGDSAVPLSVLFPPAPTPTSSPAVPATLDSGVTLRILHDDGTVEEMTMEQYLPGVVAAEMPASFQPDALRAQAVAARTYAYSKCLTPSAAHPEADLCTDYTCCQAWSDDASLAAGWGDKAEEYAQKIGEAVSSTDGQVILYDGAPIRAVFFSSAAGRTNGAVEVWGSDVPYLVGVETPEGDEVPGFRSTVSMTEEEFRALFLAEHPEADLSGDSSGWFGATEYTSSGAVAALPVGGVRVTGADLRALAGLRSANFTVSASEGAVTFSVTGYGHGVGMSQYGANAMALSGSSWQEILTHYYTGVTVASYPTSVVE